MFEALRTMASRVRAVFSLRRLDEDFKQELAAHLEMLTDENVRRE
ncbi:MAG TPA: hypothetical protein VE398_23510 [Acidobacteriota bacterium]|nr:hypothetical protein [Acidobacteriota bacterium]